MIDTLSRFYAKPLALEINTYEAIERILHARARGHRLPQADAEAWKAASPYGTPAAGQTPAQQAIVSLYGPIVGRVGPMEAMSGLTSSKTFASLVRQAADNKSVERIILDIDSPGGEAPAIDEPIDAIEYAKGLKPVVAVTQGMMLSAGYWIGATANEIVAAPNSMVGSIGIVYTHEDWSKANEAEGVKVTHLFVGDKKTLNNPDEPMTDEGRTEILRLATDYYDAFVNHVAAARGRTPALVRGEWADGRVETGRIAHNLGMVDKIGTLESILTPASSTPSSSQVTRAPVGAVLTTKGPR